MALIADIAHSWGIEVLLGVLSAVQVWQIIAFKSQSSDIRELREMFFDHIQDTKKK